MIITISGMPGSGKSSVAKELAKGLNLKHYSIGDLRGKIAMDKGMTLDELNKIGEKEDWTDKEADLYQKELGEKEDNFVIDGRLSYYFIPKSFKVFLDVNSRTGAERIFKDQREDEEKKESIEEMEQAIDQRFESDKKRYKKYYNINFPNKKDFDLVIDTTNLTLKQVVEKILKAVKK